MKIVQLSPEQYPVKYQKLSSAMHKAYWKTFEQDGVVYPSDALEVFTSFKDEDNKYYLAFHITEEWQNVQLKVYIRLG